ncbi:MAG: hypothetical protein ACJZ10_01585 [Candidatus Neomarinimicrobiota bacterium]
MKKTVLFLITSIFCFNQGFSQANQNLNDSYSITSASFFNYGTSGYEIDGFIEFQMKNMFFMESSINYEMGDRLNLNFGNDQTISFSSSIGLMKSIAKDLYAVGGCSNYTELKNNNLNEFFIGLISKSLTGIFYAGIQGSLAPNFLGIADINSFFESNIPIDISIMLTHTSSSNKEKVNKGNTNEKGFDTFLRFSKEYESGISIGYNLSQERYETPKLFTYQKSGGQTYQINRSISEIGLFHTFHVGYTF